MKNSTIAIIAGIITFTVGFLSSPSYLETPLFNETISGQVSVILQWVGGIIAVIGGGVALKNANLE